MDKCKFKPQQHVVAVVNGNGVTQGNMYLVSTHYTNAADIPCVAVIGDNGVLVYNYQTTFRTANIEAEDLIGEDAEKYIFKVLDTQYFDVNVHTDKAKKDFVITCVKKDKELQKALLVLIGGGL